jgi:hypothetical protein
MSRPRDGRRADSLQLISQYHVTKLIPGFDSDLRIGNISRHVERIRDINFGTRKVLEGIVTKFLLKLDAANQVTNVVKSFRQDRPQRIRKLSRMIL